MDRLRVVERTLDDIEERRDVARRPRATTREQRDDVRGLRDKLFFELDDELRASTFAGTWTSSSQLRQEAAEEVERKLGAEAAVTTSSAGFNASLPLFDSSTTCSRA